jgi:hypothetical protein
MQAQRAINRKHPDYKEGHKIRKGFFALLEKSTGEVVVVAKDGCFGRLAELTATQEEYALWAQGTRGA